MNLDMKVEAELILLFIFAAISFVYFRVGVARLQEEEKEEDNG